MSFKPYIWYMFCSSPQLVLDPNGPFLGEVCRRQFQGGILINDLTDLVSGYVPQIKFICDLLEGRLAGELFIVFNYNHFGPVSLIITPQLEMTVLIGYRNWNFSHYHFRHFQGHGPCEIHPVYRTPCMFYPHLRGSFDISDVIILSVIKLSEDVEITAGVTRKIMKYIQDYERGYRLTFLGRRKFGMQDIFSRILHLVIKRFGKYSFERLVQIFMDYRVYFQPVDFCDDFRQPLGLIRQFLYGFASKMEDRGVEKYLLEMGFEKT